MPYLLQNQARTSNPNLATPIVSLATPSIPGGGTTNFPSAMPSSFPGGKSYSCCISLLKVQGNKTIKNKINRIFCFVSGDFQLNTANDLQNLAGFSSPSVLSGQWPNQLSAAAAVLQQQYVSLKRWVT